MEKTSEKDLSPPERKDPDDEEGGIRRRLRDRDLLRKRKAEAEEKATNQWVYGAQSRRKRESREGSGRGKKGRPRKITPPLEAPGPQEEISPVGMAPTPEVETEPLPTIPEMPPTFVEPQFVPAAIALSVPSPGPLPASISAPALVPVPAPASVYAPAPASISAPILVPVPGPASVYAPAPASVAAQALVPVPELASASAFVPAATASWGSAEEVLIEDLGPDEEEDLPQGDLIIDQGASEEQQVDVPEQNRMFSYPLLVSPPPQSEYLPGHFI